MTGHPVPRLVAEAFLAVQRSVERDSAGGSTHTNPVLSVPPHLSQYSCLALKHGVGWKGRDYGVGGTFPVAPQVLRAEQGVVDAMRRLGLEPPVEWVRDAAFRWLSLSVSDAAEGGDPGSAWFRS